MEVGNRHIRQGVTSPSRESANHAELNEQAVEEMDEKKKARKREARQAVTAQTLAKESLRQSSKDRQKQQFSQLSEDSPYGEPELSFDDKVELSQMKWKTTDDGSVDIDPELDTPLATSVDLKYEAKEILRTKGHKINFMGQLSRLKQSFIQNYIQSKSSSTFVAQYGAFKVGVIGQTLSLLGVSSEVITQLKKKAHQQAIKENIELMGETIYNLELMELIHGNSRKTKQSRQLLMETQGKLIGQMNALDQGHYWNNDRILEEKIHQLSVILEEFKRDHRALSYQYEFMVQEVGT